VVAIPSFDALITTMYGLLVCAKFLLLLLALAVAVVSRRRIAAGTAAVVPTVRLELLVLTAVLAVTAVLVESPQSRSPVVIPSVAPQRAVEGPPSSLAITAFHQGR
jgi:putative copper export protein